MRAFVTKANALLKSTETLRLRSMLGVISGECLRQHCTIFVFGAWHCVCARHWQCVRDFVLFISLCALLCRAATVNWNKYLNRCLILNFKCYLVLYYCKNIAVVTMQFFCLLVWLSQNIVNDLKLKWLTEEQLFTLNAQNQWQLARIQTECNTCQASWIERFSTNRRKLNKCTEFT